MQRLGLGLSLEQVSFRGSLFYGPPTRCLGAATTLAHPQREQKREQERGWAYGVHRRADVACRWMRRCGCWTRMATGCWTTASL
jgi:hypothetical protein